MKKLKELLTIEPGSITKENAVDRFTAIAYELFTNYQINLGERTFVFTDIEFYWFDEKTHKDFITYPRTQKAGDWYFNTFGGVDLCFESHIEDGHHCFGGILIRGIKELATTSIYKQPRKCVDILFNHFSALSMEANFPLLPILTNIKQPVDNAPKAPAVRVGMPTGEKKKHPLGKIAAYLEYKIELEQPVFEEYLLEKYRFSSK